MFSRSPRENPSLRGRLQTALNDAEATFNAFTGSEAQWWPFGFLRPRPDAHFSTARVAVLAVLQGVPVGLFLVLFDGVARHAASERLVVFLLTVCATVFAANRFTLAYFWNRRAARLAEHRKRFEAWKAGG